MAKVHKSPQDDCIIVYFQAEQWSCVSINCFCFIISDSLAHQLLSVTGILSYLYICTVKVGFYVADIMQFFCQYNSHIVPNHMLFSVKWKENSAKDFHSSCLCLLVIWQGHSPLLCVSSCFTLRMPRGFEKQWKGDPEEELCLWSGEYFFWSPF